MSFSYQYSSVSISPCRVLILTEGTYYLNLNFVTIKKHKITSTFGFPSCTGDMVPKGIQTLVKSFCHLCQLNTYNIGILRGFISFHRRNACWPSAGRLGIRIM